MIFTCVPISVHILREILPFFFLPLLFRGYAVCVAAHIAQAPAQLLASGTAIPLFISCNV